METAFVMEHFMKFGLTRQEALIYYCLIREGKLTGYEVAKNTGISRSNVYSTLVSLVEKGAAYLQEETAKKYVSVPISEFCENYIRNLNTEKRWLLSHLTCKKADTEGYITLEGSSNILNKMKNLLAETQERAYVSCSQENLCYIEEELHTLLEEQKKVVLITDGPFSLKHAVIHVTAPKKKQVGIIVDSSYVLTGEYCRQENCTCLYSGQKNFVELYKTALSNEIKLIGYTKGEPANE